MICPYCKAEIDDDAKKCKNCGEWVNKVKDFPQREFGKTVAFAFFFGIFGVHRFYTGYKKTGVIQLILTLTLISKLLINFSSISNYRKLQSTTLRGHSQYNFHSQNIPFYLSLIIAVLPSYTQIHMQIICTPMFLGLFSG